MFHLSPSSPHPGKPRFPKVVCVMIGFLASCSLFLMGCASSISVSDRASQRQASAISTGITTLVSADVDDLDAAARVAASRLNMDVVDIIKDSTTRFYTLRTVRGEPAWLRIELPAPTQNFAIDSTTPPPLSITISAAVGRFGDADRERSLINNMKKRINQIRGDTYKPVR